MNRRTYVWRSALVAVAVYLSVPFPMGPSVTGVADASADEGAWLTAQAGCSASFCDSLHSACSGQCDDTVENQTQHAQCVSACDAMRADCADCCAQGGTDAECGQ